MAKIIKPKQVEPTVKDLILERLKSGFIGAENAISGRQLSLYRGVSPSDIRRIINELRSEKHPICRGSNGYFYAASTNEIDKTIAHLTSRSRQMNRAKEGLQCAKSVFEARTGQEEVEA